MVNNDNGNTIAKLRKGKDMTEQEILEFIRRNPVFALATAEEGRPHVRYMMLYRADEEGLIFNTGENKDLNKQLTRNPIVELCFCNAQRSVQVRVSGTVELKEDIKLKKKIVEDRPFLKEWVDEKGYDVLTVYCLRGGKAVVWTMETNFSPKRYVSL